MSVCLCRWLLAIAALSLSSLNAVIAVLFSSATSANDTRQHCSTTHPLPSHRSSIAMRTAHEIILDPAIRNWVLLPIFLVMFLQGVLRQYVSVLLKDDKKTQLDAISKKSPHTPAAVSGICLPRTATAHSQCGLCWLCLYMRV